VKDYRFLATGYFDRRPLYEHLAKTCAGLLETRLVEAGIRHTVQFRVKDFASFIRKAIRKDASDPFLSIRDFAGLRVVVPFFRDRDRVAAVVRHTLDVRGEEDTSMRHSVTEFGYRGWHFEVALRSEDLTGRSELRDQVAELQVHTRAESAWAEAGHDLIYKPRAPVPESVQRRNARLMALVELFDEQMTTSQSDLLGAPGFYEAAMLVALEQHFLPLARQEFDRQLSLEILGVLKSLYDPGELAGYEGRIRTFVASHEAFLKELYARYRADNRRNVLVFQPEALAILDLIERDPVALISAWDDALPADLLDGVARALGQPLDAYRPQR